MGPGYESIYYETTRDPQSQKVETEMYKILAFGFSRAFIPYILRYTHWKAMS